MRDFIKYRINDVKEYLHNCKGRLESIGLKNKDFTIISNNCWGGWVYRYYGLPYTSPTVGNFIISEDYIKFVKNLKKYLEADLIMIDPKECNRYELVKTIQPKLGSYPVGRLIDIDIHFLHDTDKKTALETWNRRTKRVNFNKIIIKMSTQNFWNSGDIAEFAQFDFPNKILFSTRKMSEYKDAIIFDRDSQYNDTRDEGRYYQKYINMTRYINNMKKTGEYF